MEAREGADCPSPQATIASVKAARKTADSKARALRRSLACLRACSMLRRAGVFACMTHSFLDLPGVRVTQAKKRVSIVLKTDNFGVGPALLANLAAPPRAWANDSVWGMWVSRWGGSRSRAIAFFSELAAGESSNPSLWTPAFAGVTVDGDPTNSKCDCPGDCSPSRHGRAVVDPWAGLLEGGGCG